MLTESKYNKPKTKILHTAIIIIIILVNKINLRISTEIS
jgi:hypothetical protein